MRTGVAFCTPMPFIKGPLGSRLEPITVEWHRARLNLSVPTNFLRFEIQADGMEVGEARCRAVDLVMSSEANPEFLFFLDYDVIPTYDALTKLIYRAGCFPDHDIFAGVYCCKVNPPEPLIYNRNGGGPFWDWTVGDILTEDIVGVHMGLTLIRTSLFERMEYGPDNPLFKTNPGKTWVDNGGLHTSGGSEDLFFCKRVYDEIGPNKILIDTSVIAGHINHKTGQLFGLPGDCPPVLRCPYMGNMFEYIVKQVKPLNKWVISYGNKYLHKDLSLNTEVDESGCWEKEEDAQQFLSNHMDKLEKKCLDIGAGATRRKWQGYKTFTTDIRQNVGADFVQDTRLLNFPNDHWDMIASSHHLEHIGRWEQEKVWSEIFRILKPGGKVEHIVPNIAWAATKITDGRLDEHVYNVLYGAQEAHGYAKELNTHFFGFTPSIAKDLAEASGLINVKIETYKDDPDLTYNMIIRGEKPLNKEKD